MRRRVQLQWASELVGARTSAADTTVSSSAIVKALPRTEPPPVPIRNIGDQLKLRSTIRGGGQLGLLLHEGVSAAADPLAQGALGARTAALLWHSNLSASVVPTATVTEGLGTRVQLQPATKRRKARPGATVLAMALSVTFTMLPCTGPPTVPRDIGGQLKLRSTIRNRTRAANASLAVATAEMTNAESASRDARHESRSQKAFLPAAAARTDAPSRSLAGPAPSSWDAAPCGGGGSSAAHRSPSTQGEDERAEHPNAVASLETSACNPAKAPDDGS